MHKDGPVDQVLYAVLNFLNQTWLGILVAFVTGAAVMFLAKRSPKGDWQYLREGPDKVLSAAFLLLAGLKSAPRLVLPRTDFVCDQGVGDLGLPTTTNCRFESTGTFQQVYDYTFWDFLREMFTSLAISAVAGGIGAGVGWLVARSLSPGPAPAAGTRHTG